MELKITDENAMNFAEAIGITPERQDQLAEGMNQISKKHWGQVVRTCHLFNDIAHLCKSPEELTFCIISHMDWRWYHGYPAICPPKQSGLKP